MAFAFLFREEDKYYLPLSVNHYYKLNTVTMKAKLIFIILISTIIISRKSNAQTWTPVGKTTLFNWVYSMTVYKGHLYAGGGFSVYENGIWDAANVAKLTDTTWSIVGGGTDGNVYSLTEYNGRLIGGGNFFTMGGDTAHGVFGWNDTVSSNLNTGLNPNNLMCSALTAYNGELFGGNLWFSNGQSGIGKWNGTTWSSTGFYGITFAVYNGELYAGGQSGLGKWNGSAWMPIAIVSGGSSPIIKSLTAYNGDLYAAGRFDTIDGIPASNIAKWNGSAWSTLGAGIGNGQVNALAVYNGNLYAGGDFKTAGGNADTLIAKWNGTNWSSVVPGLGNWDIHALCVYNSELYVGGLINVKIDGNVVMCAIAKLDYGLSTSIVENEIEEVIYPNPGNGMFQLKMPQGINTKETRIVVNNMLGKEVYRSATGLSDNSTIDVSSQPNGVYFLKIQTDAKSFTKKIIIQK